MSRIKRLLFAYNPATPAQGLEEVVYWAKNLKAYLFILLVSDDRLCHYGEIDPLASSKSRIDFVRYVQEEALAELKKVQAALHQRFAAQGILHQFIWARGEPVKALLNTLKTYSVDLAVLPRSLLNGRARKQLLYQTSTDLLFI